MISRADREENARRVDTLAARVGRVGLPRDRVQALSAATGANPLRIVRPCHRIVGADGSMRGFAVRRRSGSGAARQHGNHRGRLNTPRSDTVEV